MKQIDIGNSGVLASEISLGCMRINGLSPKALDSHIHAAVEAGINHFDHADIYGGGECEAAFGEVLKKHKSLRENMLIQSKCGIRKGMYDFSKEHILEAVEGSLKRLGVDYLDMLLLHRPDALMEPQEIAEAFDRLEQAGKVRRFGISNFTPIQTQLLQSGIRQKLVANQMQLSITQAGMIDLSICANTGFDGAVNRDGGVLDYCRLHNLTLQAWSPFQYGFFAGVFVDNPKFPELNKVLEELAQAYGVSKSAICVAWILRHPAKMQVIVGTTNEARLREICAASGICLSREDWYKLYLAAGHKLP